MMIIPRLRYRVKKIFDKIGKERLKLNLLHAIPFWIASFIVGLVAVLYTKIFAWVESVSAYIYKQVPFIFFALTLACFFVAWWLVKKFAPCRFHFWRKLTGESAKSQSEFLKLGNWIYFNNYCSYSSI
jgi:flagellar biosynthesis protein FliQ